MAFYWAHLIIALIIIVFIYYIIFVELLFYVYVRNIYLALPAHRLLEVTNTILITDIPKEDLLILEDIYSIFPGGIYSIYINRDLSALTKKAYRRKKLVAILEAAETRLIIRAIKSLRKNSNDKLI